MNTKDKALAKVHEVTVAIAENPIMKGLVDGGLSLIPFFGTAISSAIDSRSFELYQKNSRAFAEELRHLLQNVDDAKLDQAFIESDEFVSLVINILARNARTHEREKVKLFAKLLANASSVPTSTTPYKEGFIQVIDELSVDHIRILSYIKNLWGGATDEDRAKNREQFGAAAVAQALHLEEHRVMAYCEQMIRFGLLRDWMIGRLDYKPGHYALTDYGSELMKFLIIEGQGKDKEQMAGTN